MAKGVRKASEIIGIICLNPWLAGRLARKNMTRVIVAVSEIIGSRSRESEKSRKYSKKKKEDSMPPVVFMTMRTIKVKMIDSKSLACELRGRRNLLPTNKMIKSRAPTSRSYEARFVFGKTKATAIVAISKIE